MGQKYGEILKKKNLRTIKSRRLEKGQTDAASSWDYKERPLFSRTLRNYQPFMELE